LGRARAGLNGLRCPAFPLRLTASCRRWLPG
jgi:hypothetical protein